jgi:large subunit ribosomal protein L3
MTKDSKPRAGSLQYWPRKRAKRIYPQVSKWSVSEKTKILGFAGYKAGMTHAIIVDSRKHSTTKGEEISVPVTVLDCPPIKVLGIRAYEETPYGFVIISEVWDDKVSEDKDVKRKIIVGKFKTQEKMNFIESNLNKVKKLRIIVKTQPRKSGIGKKTPEIFEIEIGGKEIQEKWKYSKELLGKEIRIKDIFKEGEFIDVTAITTGKGTQGPVKRFGIKVQGRKAAQKRRHTGTIGSEGANRVIWTVPFAGQMGFQTRTEHNKRIIKIGENAKDVNPSSGFVNYGLVSGDYVIVEGSLPGPRKRLIILKNTVRPPKVSILPTEIKYLHKP